MALIEMGREILIGDAPAAGYRGIAQAIMENPSLIILDEPMNGLDNHGVEEIRKLLLGLREEGKLILIISHNREDINLLCDSVYEMNMGVLIQVR